MHARFRGVTGTKIRVEDKTGSLLSAAVKESTSGEVGLQFAAAFDLESDRDPGSRSRSRGTVRILGTSRYLDIVDDKRLEGDGQR